MAEPTLDRRDALSRLFPAPEDYLLVSGLAGSARYAAALTGDGDNLFTMAGTMGAAVSMGLGVALSAPEAKVVVITGDGELLMNLGVLATVASMAPDNLIPTVVSPRPPAIPATMRTISTRPISFPSRRPPSATR